MLKVEIMSTGIDIAKDQIGKLFRSFSRVNSSTTKRYGGSGLGLAKCQRLVTLMGGTIDVQSNPGTGTAFCFYLSYTTPADPHPSLLERTFHTDPKRRVLIIDDNLTQLETLFKQLTDWRLQCSITQSPLHA